MSESRLENLPAHEHPSPTFDRVERGTDQCLRGCGRLARRTESDVREKHIATNEAYAAGISIARSLDRCDEVSDFCRSIEKRGEIRYDVAPERFAGLRGYERDNFGERPTSNVLGSEKFLEHRVRKPDFAWRPLSQKANGFRIDSEQLFGCALSAIGRVAKGRAVRQIVPDCLSCFFKLVRAASARGSSDEGEPSEG